MFPKKREKQNPTIAAASNSENIETLQKGTKFSDPLKSANSNSHAFTFGVVYANDLSKSEIEKEKPNFPVGSIIVREKNETATSKMPQTVIAMVKREKGFSTETGDWEFFTFNGADLKMQTRETKSDCAKCHVQAEKTDWVFRDYLKK